MQESALAMWAQVHHMRVMKKVCDNEEAKNPSIEGTSHVMIDEMHERR